MFKKLIQYWQGGIMKTILRTPFFLILFTIFSVSFSVSSEAQAQVRDNTMMKVREFVGERNGLFLGDKGYPIEFGIARTCIETQPPIGHEGAWNMARKNRTETWLVLCKWLKKNKVDNNLPLGPDIFGARQIKNSAISFPYTMNGTEIASSDWRNGRNPEKPDGPAPTPKPVVPPVINGSYMQQMAEIEAISKEIDDLFRAGKRDEGQKKLMERNIKKENAIIGEMIRLYGNNLSTELKNFALNIDASFTAFQREAEFSMLVWKERKRLGEPPVSPPGVTPPDGPPSDDPVEAATQARDLAQQNVATSQTELDTAKAKEQEAEQTLTTAKTKLEEANAALQKAEQDAAELLARKKKEEEERLAALKKAQEEADAKRLAFEKAQREERERIAKAIQDAENARLAAIEKVKKEAEDAAKKAAEEAAKIAAEEAAQQAEELLLAENKATDAKSVRQAAEDALIKALEAAKSGDSTAKLKAQEAQQKADAAKLEFEKQAEAAQKEAKEKARLAAEAAAKQEAEVAAAVAAMQKIEAAQKAAQDLARQAQEHAAKIREAWGLPTTSAESGAAATSESGAATPGSVQPIQEETIVSPGEASISPAVESPDKLLQRQKDPAAEAAALKAAAEQAATESR